MKMKSFDTIKAWNLIFIVRVASTMMVQYNST